MNLETLTMKHLSEGLRKKTVNAVTSIYQSGVDLNASSPKILHRSDEIGDFHQVTQNGHDENNLNTDLSSFEESVTDTEMNNEVHMILQE